MKDGNISVSKDWTGVVSVKWERPVARLCHAFMGSHIKLIRYAVLPRFYPEVGYRRIVNKDWRWWRLYWAWDWTCSIALHAQARFYGFLRRHNMLVTPRWRDVRLFGGRRVTRSVEGT